MSEAFPPLLKRIETEPLVLRPVELGDVDELFEHAPRRQVRETRSREPCGASLM